MRTHTARVPLAAIALATVACGGSTNAQLQFANQTGAAAALTSPRSTALASTPGTVTRALLADGTSLRIKMLSVSLAEDVDPVTQDNIGQVSNIWINPQCANDPDHCNVAGMDSGSAGPRVTEFFDFSQTTDAVNAQLNAQDAKVTPGTYRYARLTFCKAVGNQTLPTQPTLMWKAPGMPGESSFTSGDCGRTSLPFSPPLQLQAGDTVQVTLGYDLAQSVVVGAPAPGNMRSIAGRLDPDGQLHNFRDCFDLDASTRACMDFPDFSPTARKG